MRDVAVPSTVLVTGGAGFIGSHVVDRLAAAGHRPRLLDARPSPWHDPDAVETVIGDVRSVDDVVAAAEGCAAICHLAAAADVNDVLERPHWATELNGIGTLSVLEAARRLQTPRVVYASTVWVYSDVDAEEVDEDAPLQLPAHLYTAGKLSGELYCRSYAELYGVVSTVLRFGIPYGPRARPAAVIPSFVDRARRGEPLTIAGGGEQERSFVYVEDLADGVVRALAPAAAGRTYNLGSDETTTIRALAEVVRDVVAPVEIVHREGRAGDLRGATIRNDRAAAELGWRAATPLREGVRRYAEWVAEEERRAATAAASEPEAVVAAEATSTEPASEPAATVASRPGRPRRAVARVAAIARDPLTIGLVSLIAIVSTLLPAVTATHGRADALGVMTLALVLVLPLWAIAAGDWPEALRRAQRTLAASLGVLGVVLSTSLTPEQLADVGRSRATTVTLVLLLAVAVVRGVRARARAEQTRA
ncbi:NAD-dependent epimerase/dehydratase family protein [Patulibacter defluvii]|uniref:NAD-dependent epimerase/dehydratase family protein n=1 Tax=Patulibacter defluvii TaxID=3095358 RepID=UPI002A755D1B|nr:NAD-dependent epimerase/dehydratase family protein [Patulibacter sp. DM4]